MQVRNQLQEIEPDESLIDYSRIPDLTCKNLPEWDASYNYLPDI